MTHELVLSAPGDCNIVLLEKKYTNDLLTFEKNIIRFCYNCYSHGHEKGVVLNIDLDINYINSCACFVQVLIEIQDTNSHSIIICSEDQYLHWFYFMKKYCNVDVFKLSKNNVESLLNTDQNSVLILTEKNLSYISKFVKDFKFLCLIVDQVDNFISKRIIKQVKAKFNIGITNHNFLINRDQNLQWKIINWALKESNMLYKDFTNFASYDEVRFEANIDPYTHFWYTIRWSIIESLNKERVIAKYNSSKKQVSEWAESNDLLPTSTKSTSSKQKTVASNKNRKRKADKEVEQIYDSWSTDEDIPVDLSAFECSSHANKSILNTSGDSLLDVSTSSNFDVPKLRLKSRSANTSINKSQNTTIEEIEQVKPVENEPSQSSLRKTKSAIDHLFDEALINEFNSEFISENKKSILKSKSDSILQTKKDANKYFIPLEFSSDSDDEMLRSFIHNTSYDLKSTENDDNPLISQESLESLKTKDIIVNKSKDIENSHSLDGNNKIDNSSSSSNSSDFIRNFLGNDKNKDQKTLDNNYESFSEISETLNLRLSEEVGKNISPVLEKFDPSSDDELDNYLLKFIASTENKTKKCTEI